MTGRLDDYRERLSARELSTDKLRRANGMVGVARLSVAIITIATAWWALHEHAHSFKWTLVPLAVFIGLVLYHGARRRQQARAERAADYYRKGIARIEDRWVGSGLQGDRFNDPHHVYGADLDLFGRGSLFELLCVARTRMGEESLARWLLSPAPVETVRARQAAVVDLAARRELREDLAVTGEGPGAGVQPAALLAWAEATNVLSARWLPWAGVLLPVALVAALIFGYTSGIASPAYLVVLAEIVVLSILATRIKTVLHGTQSAFEDLRMLAEILFRIEREDFQAPALRDLAQRLRSHARAASHTIGKLSTIVNLAGSRRNQIVAVIAIPVMYPLNVALGAERWRKKHGAVVRSWVEALGEFEAMVSLATYHHEHPQDPFPEFVADGAHFAATALGHPLIPATRCVRNDVGISSPAKVLLISGSNMSGKSTLLRTVGINVVLAMSGAPVRAGRFALAPLQVGASIRINDSLHDGSSRFYAEIVRLRQLLDLAGANPPLLFLLDELLQGTNSKDRRIGAEGIVRAFVERGSIGLISTHDLAVADLSGLGSGALHNVHFQDELRDGKMTFDFTLREGIVTKSNGVELMRSIGLDV